MIEKINLSNLNWNIIIKSNKNQKVNKYNTKKKNNITYT